VNAVVVTLLLPQWTVVHSTVIILWLHWIRMTQNTLLQHLTWLQLCWTYVVAIIILSLGYDFYW